MLFVLLLFDLGKERRKIRHTGSNSIIILLQKCCQKIDRVSVLTACAGGVGSDIHCSTGVGTSRFGGSRPPSKTLKTLLVCYGPYGSAFRKWCV